MLERVQHRATRIIYDFKGLCYEERLKRTGLMTLEDRRIRGDLIQAFRIIGGIDKVDYKNYFKLSEEKRTR